MNRKFRVRLLATHTIAAIAALHLAAGTAAAQTVFRCQDAAGKTVISDKACDPTTKPAGVISTQPALGPRWDAPARPPGTPEHYDYLSPACRSLNDAMRSARSRGNSYQQVRQLQDEYRQRCQDDEQDAQRAYWEKKQGERTERVAAKKAQVAQVQQERNEKQLCADMGQILAAKRARTDLTAAERAELQRFADNHRARCLQ